MVFDVLFAGVPVGDLRRARRWYASLIGRDCDVIVNDREVMWPVSAAGWLYLVEDPAKAGRAVVALAVADLDDALAEMAGRGIRSGPVEVVGEAGRKSVAADPEGNEVSVIEVASGN